MQAISLMVDEFQARAAIKDFNGRQIKPVRDKVNQKYTLQFYILDLYIVGHFLFFSRQGFKKKSWKKINLA